LIGSPDDADLWFLQSENARRYIHQLPRFARQPLGQKFTNLRPAAADLVNKMLVFDPAQRITVADALRHEYLAQLHDINDEPVCEQPFEFDFERPSLTEEHIKDLIYMESLSFNPLPPAMT
jgi:serine/threonine protein kinase